tara:strand:- start:105 stop:824 length:720 start_codon:yes stop_codon:yes gene_type:complete
MKPALEMRKVERDLGGKHMSFDFSRARGSITAILGPSGSGKSTLLNLIAGFLAPDSGEIRIDGTDVSHRPPGERGVSMVFQDNNLFAHLDIATNIGLGLDPALQLDDAQKDRIASSLERVGLSGYEKRLPGTLSGGERQRVALARAFARARPVLLLDEPFDGLGPGLAADMLSLMLEIRSDVDATVLMVTHDPREAASAADEILFIDQGRIAANSPMEGFFERTDLPALSAYLRGRPEV